MRLLFTMVAFSCVVASTQAQIFVNYNAQGSNDGTSWENAFTSLNTALEQSLQGDQLWITAGMYVPTGSTPETSHFVVNKAIELYGGFAGTESKLEDRNWEANPTILSGDINGDDTLGNFELNREDNAHHVIVIQSHEGPSVIDGIILQSGTTFFDDPFGNDYSPWRGGGALTFTEAVFRNCVFTDNNGWQGSALSTYTDSTIHGLTIKNCTFTANNTIRSGALRVADIEDFLILECQFLTNYARGFGGALVLGNTSGTVQGCHFEQNSSGWGGAIGIFQNASSEIFHPKIIISGSTFKLDSARSEGGAIAVRTFARDLEINIDSSKFIQNASVTEGGAIRVRSISDSYDETPSRVYLRIHESDFIENTSLRGGAMLCWSEKDSLELNISNSRFTRNQSEYLGGGLYVLYQDSSEVNVRLNQVIFDRNSAQGGAGLLFSNNANIKKMQFELDSCIFKDNVATDYGGGFASRGSNGSITNSEFIDNKAISTSGALFSRDDSLRIDKCLFAGNYSVGSGGASWFWEARDISVSNTIFSDDTSQTNGSATSITSNSKVRFENVLFKNNPGNSTIYNEANLSLRNVTMVENQLGIFQQKGAHAEFQNTILNNIEINYVGNSDQNVESKGGNISNDGSMVDVLTESGNYKDRHETDPELDTSYVPLAGGPCFDTGNPEGVTAQHDLAGLPRIMNNGIDIGAFEGLEVAVRDIVRNGFELNVFPNPVSSYLKFEIDDDWTGVMHLSILDLSGRKVFSSTQSKTSGVQLFQENVSHLTTGEYFVVVSIKDATYTSKVIIQN